MEELKTKSGEEKDFKSSCRDFLFSDPHKIIDYENSFTLNLNLKTYHKGFNRYIDPQCDVNRNFRDFMNRLNQKCYGRNFKRGRSTKINVIPILEKSISGKYHYHGIIEVPKYSDGSRMDKNHFHFHIWDTWRSTEWGEESLKKIKIDNFNSDPTGWNSYITKTITENSEIDSIDWGNYHWEPK